LVRWRWGEKGRGRQGEGEEVDSQPVGQLGVEEGVKEGDSMAGGGGGLTTILREGWCVVFFFFEIV